MEQHNKGREEHKAVLESLALYFDGLYFSDTVRLKQIFHERARYICASDGTLTCFSMEEYMPIVAARPSPCSQDEARRDRVLSVELAGPNTAFARVECSISEKFFTDFLSLIKVDGRWQIISKVFHYELIKGTS